MLIELTESDIKNGMKQSCRYCPISLAIQRKIKDKNISTYNDTVSIGGEFYGLPSLATNFIYQFDGNKTVFPFSFELILEESNRLHTNYN